MKPENNIHHQHNKISCDFGVQLSTYKRPHTSTLINKGKKNPHNPPPPPPPPVVTTYPGVILLDFDGQVVENTSWNTAGPITAIESGLSPAERAYVLSRVTEAYAPFQVTVISSDQENAESIYASFTLNRRMRVILTETYEWFGLSGGVSFTNSFTWGNDTPCFVFTSALGYNTNYIGEAASHEPGHTFGNYHQSVYDASGVKIAEYRPGYIMGNSYQQLISNWTIGPNSLGYTFIQDDAKNIAAVVGYK